MIGNTRAFRTRFRLLSILLQTLCVILCALFLSQVVSAQQPRIVSFDAPGADTTPGDYNGTYPSAINALGVVAGAYQSADTVFHGFLRSERYVKRILRKLVVA
jgi:hypothetical protein